MSSAGREHPPSYPAVPASLSAGEYEMRDYYARDPPRTTPHTAPALTPYLGLRARLSQVWINRWTILLLLVLARALLAVTGLNNDLDSARREALSACTGVESMGSAMASMPHYMSQGVNELAATGVEKAVNGLMSMLLLSVTGVEEIILFYINLLTSTYVCLITLAVSGSLHSALKVIEDVKDFLNKTLGDIGSDIHQDVNSFQTDLNKFVSALNSLPASLGSSKSIPTLNVNSSIDELDNIKLPSTLDEGLTKLNSSIPTFSQVHNFTNNVLRSPFEEVKKLINESRVAYKFDKSVFPVPQKEQLTFCSDNNGINDFFNDLSSVANLARRIFIGVIVVLAILVCIPMAYREIRRWRSSQRRAQLLTQNAFDPMDVVQIASRPISSTIGIKAASKFSTTRRQILVRWFVAYCTTTPALVVLSLGLAGLLACLCQYILLKSIEKEVPALANQVGAFADKVVGVLNNASEEWADGTNRVITSTNNGINQDVFGWVNTTTGAVNDTLNTFVDDMTDALNTTFGGTVLYDPITEVLNCLITLKIKGIQQGLTWVSDNAKVDFPLFPNNTFSLGAADSIAKDSKDPSDSFLATTGSQASDQITNAVVRMVNKITDGIRTEAIISTCVVLVWIIIVLIGLVRTAVLFYGHDKTRGEGGPTYARDLPPAGAKTPDATVFPAFNPSAADIRHSDLTARRDWPDEKLGYAGQRNDVIFDRGHARASSHGDVASVDEKR